jgi:hypothetical protein
VKDLAKLDLEPNTVYNVSLNVAQGAKKFDNLRFFQTKTPKLFNIIPGQYSTFSRLTTALEPVVPKIGGGTYNAATLQTVDITSVSWHTAWKFDTSEGQSARSVDGSTVTFRIKLASSVPTFVFQIEGFSSKLACLNGRSDWKKIDSKTYEVTTSVREFDPDIDVINNYVFKDSKTLTAKYAVQKGQTLIYTNQVPTGAIDGRSNLKGSASKGKSIFPVNTKLVIANKTGAPYYIIASQPTLIGFPINTSITVGSFEWSNAATWTGGRTSSESDEGTNATLKYYSSPSYSPITTTYSFTGNSSINSEVLNTTVLDSLIWEENIRDFIYFFISDTTSANSPTWYYFNNSSANGGITPGNLDGLNITGTALSIVSGSGEERILSGPPPAPVYVTGVSSYPSYPAVALKAKAKFYEISKTNQVNDATVPSLSRPIGIRFAIARYTKGSTGAWSGIWLGVDNKIKNVLSLEEALS